MYDPLFAIGAVDRMIKEAGNPLLSYPDKAGLFAAFSTMLGEMETYLNEKRNPVATSAIVDLLRYHFGAATGFVFPGNQDIPQHIAWAKGHAHTLRTYVIEVCARDALVPTSGFGHHVAADGANAEK